MPDFRYPIGQCTLKPRIDAAERNELITNIDQMPVLIRAAVARLTDTQLDTPYRDGGWTVRQVVHHVADSHMNAYTRMRLAATEDSPAIKTYDEKAWAELADSRNAPVDLSLTLIDALHRRWTMWLRSIPSETFARPAQHPDHGLISLDTLIQIYGWHSRHHVAHITELRKRKEWR
jgi:hypothetical protein